MENELLLVMSYLDKIGEKLGIGANMIWPYVMRQEMAEAVISIVLAIVMVTIFLIVCPRFFNHPKRVCGPWPIDLCAYAWAMVVSGASGLISTMYFMIHGIFQLINTEYMAYKTLLNMIRMFK